MPGWALVVRADGRLAHAELPGLVDGPGSQLDTYARVHASARSRGGERKPGEVRGEAEKKLEATDKAATNKAAAVERWRQALDELCDWAWRVAVGPLLDRAAELGLEHDSGSRPLRLVLVPCGALGTIPWHAARVARGDGYRYACEDAVFSYAATARQLVEVSTRHIHPPGESPVLVAPDPTLYDTARSTDDLRDVFYPAATCYGPVFTGGDETPVTPDDILAWLPGTNEGSVASLVHFGAHGHVDTDPLQSRIRLGPDTSTGLTVTQVLRQSLRREPDSPAGMIVLMACSSDLIDEGHDEVLTLATALLAGGSACVVGSRWDVLDIQTNILMFMFHHFLHQGGPGPGNAADALRAAQLWMLDPGREIPPAMPARLAEKVWREAAADELDLAAVHSWAAFTHQGR